MSTYFYLWTTKKSITYNLVTHINITSYVDPCHPLPSQKRKKKQLLTNYFCIVQYQWAIGAGGIINIKEIKHSRVVLQLDLPNMGRVSYGFNPKNKKKCME